MAVCTIANQSSRKLAMGATEMISAALCEISGLAARCLSKEAVALKPNGQFFTEDMIGDALATREILSEMREAGVFTGGPPAFQKKDRSRFLQSLEQAIRSPPRRLF